MRIRIRGGKLVTPERVEIPYIEGDGIGPEVIGVARRVISSAVEKTYETREIEWKEIFAGEKAKALCGELLPKETLKAIEQHVVALKGPITTPVGSGYRSLNVAIRQALDLYACIRPVFYIRGVPSPMKNPEQMDIVIFRENTEDVYLGIEWEQSSEQAAKLREFLEREFGIKIRKDAGIGLKPISEFCTKRLVRKAITYALEKNRKSVTLVHKGNIMKYTEGAFKQWGYEVASEFGDRVIREEELGKKPSRGRLVVKDRIADNMLQQLLTRTSEYDVIATTNLNGDYLSDAAAGQIGGLGVAPSANVGDFLAVFEATHGSAPKYAGLNKVNPTSVILAGAMMLEYIGWNEAGEAIRKAVEKTVMQRFVTYDLARQMSSARLVGTREFGDKVVENLEK